MKISFAFLLRRMTLLIVFACWFTGSARAQWLETTILLPDNLGKTSGPGSIAYNSLNNKIYVGGGVYSGGEDSYIVVIDGTTNKRIAHIPVEVCYSSVFWESENNVFVESGIRAARGSIDALNDSIPFQEGWPKRFGEIRRIWPGIISPVPVDLDADGIKELVFTQQGEPSLLFAFEPDGSLKFDPVEMPSYCPYTDPRTFPSIDDIDNDGLKEIIIPFVFPYILVYDCSGALKNVWHFDAGAHIEYYDAVAIADLDFDGNKELMYTSWWPGSQLVVLDNQGHILPGFPVTIESVHTSESHTPTVGNLDEDAVLEIVTVSYATAPKKVSHISAFNIDGSKLWSKALSYTVANDAVIGDINDDGYNEVAFSSALGIHILDRFGNFVLNKGLGGSEKSAHSNVALGDLDSDGDLELVFGYRTRIYAIHHNGGVIWSKDVGWNAHYPPVIGDIDGDGRPDVVVTQDFEVYAWDYEGDVINNFPIPVRTNAYGACSISDIDNDGDVELIASSDWVHENDTILTGYIYVWDIQAPYSPETMEWPMYQHDPQHTGFYSAPATGIKEQETTSSGSDNIHLFQNAPNPFTSVTEISFIIKKLAGVNLAIYNGVGQIVKTLINDMTNPGYYTIQWNGQDNGGKKVTPNIYFYKLQSDNYTETRKMVLLR